MFELKLLNEYEEETKCGNVTLKMINKYQINSYINIIESFLFDSDLKKFSMTSENKEINGFNLENSLKLATCFYGKLATYLNNKIFRCIL